MAQNIDPRNGDTTGRSGASGSSDSINKSSETSTGLVQDNHAVTKRLQRELMQLMSSGEKGVSAFPDGDSLFKWAATVKGPEATPYADLTFRLTVSFPHSYPYSPPAVRFVTTTFHPNVDLSSGKICLDILKDKWSPSYDLRSVLLSIQSLLSEPNVDSPLNTKAAALWTEDLEVYRQNVLANINK